MSNAEELLIPGFIDYSSNPSDAFQRHPTDQLLALLAGVGAFEGYMTVSREFVHPGFSERAATHSGVAYLESRAEELDSATVMLEDAGYVNSSLDADSLAENYRSEAAAVAEELPLNYNPRIEAVGTLASAALAGVVAYTAVTRLIDSKRTRDIRKIARNFKDPQST